MPRNGFPKSNLILNKSRVQLIFTENSLLGGDGRGDEPLDQQPCKYNINIW